VTLQTQQSAGAEIPIPTPRTSVETLPPRPIRSTTRLGVWVVQHRWAGSGPRDPHRTSSGQSVSDCPLLRHAGVISTFWFGGATTSLLVGWTARRRPSTPCDEPSGWPTPPAKRSPRSTRSHRATPKCRLKATTFYVPKPSNILLAHPPPWPKPAAATRSRHCLLVAIPTRPWLSPPDTPTFWSWGRAAQAASRTCISTLLPTTSPTTRRFPWQSFRRAQPTIELLASSSVSMARWKAPPEWRSARPSPRCLVPRWSRRTVEPRAEWVPATDPGSWHHYAETQVRDLVTPIEGAGVRVVFDVDRDIHPVDALCRAIRPNLASSPSWGRAGRSAQRPTARPRSHPTSAP
jgi:hypothetical protein